MDSTKNNHDIPPLRKLTPGIQLLISDVVAGATLTEASRQRNYSVSYACRMLRSEQGQREVARMRSDVEMLLSEKLANLFSQSLDIIQRELNSPIPDRRLAAAGLVVKISKPLIDSITLNASEGGTIIEHVPHAPAMKPNDSPISTVTDVFTSDEAIIEPTLDKEIDNEESNNYSV